MADCRLVFAFTAIRAKKLRDSGALCRNSDVVVVWSPGCALELRRQGYTVSFAHGLLRGEDFSRTVVRSRQLAACWWKPFYEAINMENVCIADAMQRDMWFAFFAACNSETMVKRLVAQTGADSALVYASYATPTFWDPPSGPWPDVADAAARFALERLAVNTEVIDVPAASSFSQAIPKGLEEVMKAMESRRGLQSVAICNELDFFKIKHMMQNPDEWVVGKIDAYAERTNLPSFAWYDFLSNFQVTSDVASLVDRQSEAFNEWRSSSECDDPVLANPYLDFQFRHFADRIKLGTRIVTAASWLFREFAPKKCLLGLDAYGPGVLLNRTAKQCGVPTTSVLHGTISPHFTQYDQLESEADTIVVEGEYHAREFVKMGRSPESIVVSPLVNDLPAEGAPLVECGQVLLVTSLTGYGLSLPMVDPEQLLRDWKAIVSLSEKRLDMSFVIKAHPRYDHLSLYRQLVDLSGGRIHLELEKNLVETLRETRAVVLMGMPSGATLEILKAQVPLVYFHSPLLNAPEFRSPLDGDMVRRAGTVSQLEATLDLLMADGQERQEAIADGNALLKDLRGATKAFPNGIEA